MNLDVNLFKLFIKINVTKSKKQMKNSLHEISSLF